MNKNSFMFYFPVCILFISVYLIIALASTSGVLLKSRDEKITHLPLFLILETSL